MCIIAIKKKNQELPQEEVFQTMFKNNSDGAGFMYNYDGKVIIQKGYMSYNSFKAALETLKNRVDVYAIAIVFHFRIATHGSVSPALCHPFPMSHKIPMLKKLYSASQVGIVHNGIIPIKPRKGISDTMEYIASVLSKREKHNPKFYKSKKIRKAILAEIDSKMTFLDYEGNVYTVGEFISDNGILYSNSSYKEREFNFKFWSDYMYSVVVSPIEDGYIITDKSIIECEYGQYFIDKYGRIFEYDECYDFAYEICGSAYTIHGYPVVFNEDNAVCISVM